jgi:Rrf2 family transcriptional regulator, cysteine metabolism repressor
MRVPTKARYGLRAMLDLATHDGGDQPVLVKDIAARQGLSERYLTQIFISLRHAGLVRSVRGSKGGFLLARDAARINMLEIVEACIGDLSMVDCIGDPAACDKVGGCATYVVWKELSEGMRATLAARTLSDLVAVQNKMDSKEVLDFSI